MSSSPKTRTAETVVLTLPGSGAYLGILRTTTAGLAARLGFGLDAVEDLRVAVDEACNLLLNEPAAQITCRFYPDVEGVAIDLEAPHSGGRQRWADTFAWQLLSSLAQDVAVVETSDTVTITLRKNFSSS
jgi:serine/threonine-protein kinase RsbW